MIEFISGFVVGSGLVLACEFYLYDKNQREEQEFRLDILRSVFVDNPLPIVGDYDSFQSPEAIGLRVQLETGEIIYGRADGMKVSEIDGIQWGEMGGVEAIAQMNAMDEDDDFEDDDD
jgi:hypothetical protein